MNTEKKTGIVYINSYFNRIFVRFFDENSELICMESSDSLGLHITRDNIQSVASKVALIAANKAKYIGVTNISGVHAYGWGPGINNAIQALQDSGFVIPYIKDMNPIPHNGCRPSKRIKKS